MTWSYNIKKYIIQSDKSGYFRPGQSGSLYYNESDFVDSMEEAYWYARKDAALSIAFELTLGKRFGQVKVTKIEVSIRVIQSADDFMKVELNENKKLVEELTALSDQEVEDLSVKQWKIFKQARTFMKIYTG